MADYRKLRVTGRAAELTKIIYKLAAVAQSAGHPGLADQMERAVGSIGANIAEGSGHKSRKEFSRYLNYSIASTCELETHVGTARDIELISWPNSVRLFEEIEGVRKMLTRLRDKLDGK
jgi:four helix bundle protein